MAFHPRHAVGVCSGYGGIDLGLRLALGGNCRTILYCEREAFAAAILVAEMEAGNLDPAPVWSDLATLPAGDVIGRLGIDPADVMLHGGIPCQPWSVAGDRCGADDSRWLWPAFWRVAQDGAMGWIFLENVRGFVSGGPAGLDLVLRDLSGAGWNAEWDLFSAAECGAPHKRERLFLLAHAPGIGRGEMGAELPRRQGNATPFSGGVVGGRHPDPGCHVGYAECAGGRAENPGRRGMERQGGVFPEREESAGGPEGAGFELADSDRRRQSWTSVSARSRAEGQGASDIAGDGEGVADAGGAGREGRERGGSFRDEGPPPRGSVGERRGDLWPAPPGPQHAWEPPRIVQYRRSEKSEETQPRLGGGADGSAAVVDKRFGPLWSGRISALGNGVAPVVAALAYVTLWERLMEAENGE